MRMPAGRLIVLAASCALGSWGCLLALDFEGFDTSGPTSGSEGGAAAFGDFVLTATPRSISLLIGAPAATIDLAIEARGGFAATIDLGAPDMPTGIHLAAQGVVIPAGATSAKLALSADGTARPGRRTLTLRANAGPLVHDVTVEIVVRGPPGSVDTSFGDGGIVVTALTGNATFGDMVVLADDRILFGGGDDDDAGVTSFALARYTADGELDVAFGDKGKVTTRLPAATSAAIGASVRGLAALPNGPVVAAGGPKGAGFVARYRADGSLDPAFGTQGLRSITDDLDLRTLMRRPGGSLVLAGTQGVNGITLLQLQASGSVDTTFADAGFATHAARGTVNAATLGADGTVVVAARTGRIFDMSCSPIAFLADGTSIAGGSESPGCSPQQIALDDAGYRTFTALGPGPGASTIYSIHLEAPDGGAAVTPGYFASPESSGTDITFDALGRILTAEEASPGGCPSFAVRRSRRDLTPDVAFTGSGLVTTPIGDSATAHRVRVQSDGRIVAAGTTTIGGLSRFALVRYWP